MKKNRKSPVNKKVIITNELYLDQEEYDLMSKILKEEELGMKNLEFDLVSSAISNVIGEKEWTESSWADDLDWNTRMFLHCTGEIDLSEKGEDASAERNLLHRLDEVWSVEEYYENDLRIDIVLDKSGELRANLENKWHKEKKEMAEKAKEDAYKRACEMKIMIDESKEKHQIMKKMKLTDNEYLKTRKRINAIQKYIRLKNEGVPEKEIASVLKKTKTSINTCKKYIKRRPDIFK